MTLLELPRRRAEPRVFLEPPHGLARRVRKALVALGDLPHELDGLPGLDVLGAALVAVADAFDDDPDLEPDADDEPEPFEPDADFEPKQLPLFPFEACAPIADR